MLEVAMRKKNAEPILFFIFTYLYILYSFFVVQALLIAFYSVWRQKVDNCLESIILE